MEAIFDKDWIQAYDRYVANGEDHATAALYADKEVAQKEEQQRMAKERRKADCATRGEVH